MTATEPHIAPDTPTTTIDAEYTRLRSAADNGAMHGHDDRRRALRALRDMLVTSTSDAETALAADLGKSAIESWMTEIGFTIGQIDHALDHLDHWARPRRVRLQMTLRPGSARIVPTPLGLVGIIAPWNYPLQLTLAPLVAAITAGNTAMVKPSELAPATSAFLADRLPAVVGDHVGVVTGGVEPTSAMLEHRFDHMFYTGGARVARVVATAAARHLTPTTLELGGKSPAIVTESADLRIAARRIAWGRFVNAGQTCVAPDYVLVPRHLRDGLVQHLVDAVGDLYGPDPSASEDYGKIINTHHLSRLVGYLSEDGAGQVVIGGSADPDRCHLDPTVVIDPDPSCALMTDEIFGPILPVVTYDDLDDAIAQIRSRPHPLALYLFSTNDDQIAQVTARTTSGGMLVNHTLLHLAAEDLPFGGVGESGMGAYHGQVGFDTFSHLRSVMRRPMRPDPSLMYPPYGPLARRLLRRLF